MRASDSRLPETHGEAVDMANQHEARDAGTNVLPPKEGFSSIQDIDSDRSADIEDLTQAPEGSKSTRNDLVAMRRMGKDQQFVRNFRFVSITAFVAIATASWEIGLFIITPGLVDGGRAGLIWSVLWSFIGFAPIWLSMAEMASMAPIAGAQYHWVSEFAPESCQRFLSYVAGWVSTIAWQAGNAMGIFLVGSMVQTIILINDDTYGFASWQGTLLAIGAAVVCFVAVVYGGKRLPYVQVIVFAFHIGAYFAYVVPIWVNAPRASHHQVWGEFQNTGGWSSLGLAVMVGQLTGISEQVGIDTTAHMAEEIKDAASAIPKTIMTVYVINFLLLFPAIVTICYHVPDLSAALNDPTTYPAIYVLRQSMSTPCISALLAVICLIMAVSNINYYAAVTRDLFAFARDQGLPFSKWLSKVDTRRNQPVNACGVSALFASLLSLIYIGSPVAFYAITSLATVSLLLCYSMSIGCILWRRIYEPHTLPPAPFSLGRWGVPINSAAVLFCGWSFFWSFWPQSVPVTASGFNWASPIFVVVIIVSLLYFVFKAKHKYVGPVTEVEGRKEGFVGT